MLMKKYLLLLALPMVLVGCNEDNDQAVLQPDQELVEESDQHAVTDSMSEDDQSDAQVDEDDQAQTSDQSQNADADNQGDNSEDDDQNSTDDTQTSNESSSSEANDNQVSNTETETDSTTSDQSESGQANAVQVSNSDENDELALKAVEDYIDYNLEDYIYLVHPEENSDWIQVEIREQMPDQDQTNLIDLYRYNSETEQLEVFDFIEGTYLPVD